MAPQHTFQPPTGTRDLYPVEAARRRYITEAWRSVAINHGFEEIDGPTFEHLDLYTVKSGEGIVSELFSFRREGGEKDYALRPEFTPTLARMYAAKAASLPRPTKWFSVGPYFRAERPQRGRLREFLQWNADCIGPGDPVIPRSDAADDEAAAYTALTSDFEILSCCIDLLRALGISHEYAKVRFNFRQATSRTLARKGVREDAMTAALNLLDAMNKIDPKELDARAAARGIPPDAFSYFRHATPVRMADPAWPDGVSNAAKATMQRLSQEMHAWGIAEWCEFDPRIARGLAYYTGTVFEVVVDNERAIAGGGRYDNLIELFGGPPTPAVGFGMGDVVLSLVLQDKGLMPSDAELLGLAGQTPDAFVIAAAPDADPLVPRVLAALRRPTPRALPASPLPSPHSPLPSLPGLHARRSYKTTRNVGKLLQEAAKLGARFAVILENASTAKLKDMTTGAQDEQAFPIDSDPALAALALELRRRLGRG